MPDNRDDAIDDLDFSDLDLEGGDTDFTGDVAPEEPKKKGPDIVTLAIYAGMGLAVVGVIVWQMGLLGGGNSAPAPAGPTDTVSQTVPVDPSTSDPFNVMGTPENAGLQMDTVDPAAATAPGAPADPATPGAMPPEMVDAMTPTGAAPTGDTTALPTSSIPIDSSALPEQGMDSIPMPTPVSDVATAEAIPQQGMIPAPTPAMTSDTGIAVPATSEIPVQPATPTPAVQPIESQPAVTGMVPATPEAAATPPAEATATPNVTLAPSDMTAILDRLEAIEKRLNQETATPTPAISSELQDLKAAVARLEAGGISQSSAAQSDEEPKKPAAKPKKKTVAKKKSSAPKKSSSASDAPYNGGALLESKSSANSMAPVTSRYTLRSAQSNTAWVSDGNGTLQEVRVGDSLPGVGTVRSIEQQNGRWMVVGSDGQIAP